MMERISRETRIKWGHSKWLLCNRPDGLAVVQPTDMSGRLCSNLSDLRDKQLLVAVGTTVKRMIMHAHKSDIGQKRQNALLNYSDADCRPASATWRSFMEKLYPQREHCHFKRAWQMRAIASAVFPQIGIYFLDHHIAQWRSARGRKHWPLRCFGCFRGSRGATLVRFCDCQT
jgi:hypothetical protein